MFIKKIIRVLVSNVYVDPVPLELEFALSPEQNIVINEVKIECTGTDPLY